MQIRLLLHEYSFDEYEIQDILSVLHGVAARRPCVTRTVNGVSTVGNEMASELLLSDTKIATGIFVEVFKNNILSEDDENRVS